MPLTSKMLSVVHRAIGLRSVQTVQQIICQLDNPRELRTLIRYRLIRTFDVLAFDPGELVEPLAFWNPGNPEPDLVGLIHSSTRRRTAQRLSKIKVGIATRRAGNLLDEGRESDAICPFQIGHSIGVSAMILARAESNPDDHVVGESTLRASRHELGLADYLPDAAVILPGGKVRVALDFFGQYGLGRAREIHKFSAAAGIGWEAW